MGRIRDQVRRAVARRLKPHQWCSACERSRADGVRLISGVCVYLCEACVRDAIAHATANADELGPPTRCRFCSEVRPTALPAESAAIAVCATCIRMASEVFAEDAKYRGAAT